MVLVLPNKIKYKNYICNETSIISGFTVQPNSCKAATDIAGHESQELHHWLLYEGFRHVVVRFVQPIESVVVLVCVI